MSVLVADEPNETNGFITKVDYHSRMLVSVCTLGLGASLLIGFGIGKRDAVEVKQPTKAIESSQPDNINLQLPLGTLPNLEQREYVRPNLTIKPKVVKVHSEKVNFNDAAKWYYDVESNRMTKRNLK